jgi:hypothetical protein
MASHMVISYGPQAAQANEELPSESSVDLTLTQHPCDEDLEPREVLKLNPLSLVLSYFYELSHPGDFVASQPRF